MGGPEGAHIGWIPFDPIRPGGWESDRLATVDRVLPHFRRFIRVRRALADAGAVPLAAPVAEPVIVSRTGTCGVAFDPAAGHDGGIADAREDVGRPVGGAMGCRSQPHLRIHADPLQDSVALNSCPLTAPALMVRSGAIRV